MDRLVEKALSAEETDACQQLYNIIQNFAKKKGQIGKRAPTASCPNMLLIFLVSDDHPRTTRRWAGILLEAIVSHFPVLRQYVLKLTNLLPFLGGLVAQGDEDMKLLGATLIRTLVENDRQALASFWNATELKHSQIEKFPLSKASAGKQWIEDLRSFMDDAFPQKKVVSSTTKLQAHFTQAVTIQIANSDEKLQLMPEDRSIYMILQNRITIMTIPILSSDPFFLDVPFNMISGTKITTSTLVASSQEPKRTEKVFQLLLNMKLGVCNHRMYAQKAEAQTMLFTFMSKSQAEQVAAFIDDECIRIQQGDPKISMSQPLNVSRGVETNTSPQRPSETAVENASSYAVKVAGFEPAETSTRPVAPLESQISQAPQRKSKRTTTGASPSSKKGELVTATSPSRRTGSSSLNNDDSNIEYEAEQSPQILAAKPEMKTRPSAGNLAALLSAALSPEPFEPIFRSIKDRPNHLPSAVKTVAEKVTKAGKQKSTSSTRAIKPKQGGRVAKKAKRTIRSKYKQPAPFSDQPEKLAEDNEIWDIPDDPEDLATTAKNIITGSAKSTMATRKGPTRSARASESKRRSRVIESDSEIEQDGTRSVGILQLITVAQIPSSSPRRSTRLQASAARKTAKRPQIRTDLVVDESSYDVKMLTSSARHSSRIEAPAESLGNGIEKQASNPTGVKKSGTEKHKKPLANREKTIGVVVNSRGGKQSDVAFLEQNKAPKPNPTLLNNAAESIEAFEDAIVDYHSDSGVQGTRAVIKREPGTSPKDSRPAKTTREGSQIRPISIESDPESDSESETGIVSKPLCEFNQQPERKIARVREIRSKDALTDYASTDHACDEVSTVEDSYPMIKHNLNLLSTAPSDPDVQADEETLVGDSCSLTKRTATPDPTSEPTLVDNRSVRKMAMISFGRSGPRNQGLRLGIPSASATPVVRLDPLQAPGTTESQDLGDKELHTQPNIHLPGYIQAQQTGQSKVRKRPTSDDVQEGEPMKRHRISQSLPGADGHVDVDSFSDLGRRPSRKASQKSVHVTDEGSPIRDDLPDYPVAAMANDFGYIEDDPTPRESGHVIEPIYRVSVGSNVERFPHKALREEGPLFASKTQHLVSKPKNASVSGKREDQWPTITNRHQLAQDSDYGDIAEESRVPILRSSRARSSSEGIGRELNRKTNLLAESAIFEVTRRRSSSGRTQRITAPLSSNHKPGPQPPGLDSQVISAYAPEAEIHEAVARNRAENIANNPFSSGQKDEYAAKSSFMRRLTSLMSNNPTYADTGLATEDPDRTLVEGDPMEDIDSSSSDEGLAIVEEVAEEEDITDDDNMEWEAALRPRQRAMFEVLGRITRRLVSHLIDSETAADDIVNDYERDGTRIVNMFESHCHEQRSQAGGYKASVGRFRKVFREQEIAQGHERLQADVGSAVDAWKTGLQIKNDVIAQMERLVAG